MHYPWEHFGVAIGAISGVLAAAHKRIDMFGVIVLALVNHGAEVIADGNIHVYAPLRGKAIAGARGNADARIFASSMEAELVAIAGIYRTAETPLPAQIFGKSVQVRLDGEKLLIEALKL